MMENNIVIKINWLNFIIALFFIISFPTPSYPDNENISKAEEYFQKGLDAFNNRDWTVAQENFEKSYKSFSHPMVSYMLSCTYMEMTKPEEALKFANIALKGTPKLEKRYLEGVDGIKDWVKKVNSGKIIMEGKADRAGPLVKRPKPAIPDTNNLQIKAPIATMNFTGLWRCNDRGSYFIRQVGNEIWWYGQSGDGGKSWSNVFHGQIRGNKVIGKWADVPYGRTQNFGEIILEIIGAGKLVTTKRTGGFGGSEWYRR